MKNFDENKDQRNINIHLGTSKRQVLKLFFLEYKLISFLVVVCLLLGVKFKDTARSIYLFIVLPYFIFALIRVVTDSWKLTMYDSTVYVSVFFRKYVFNIRELINVQVDYERSDNQQEVMIHDPEWGPRRSLFWEIIREIIKIEEELIVINIEFFCNQGMVKLKLPYSKIKMINNREKVYQYTSDEDLSTLFWLLNSKDNLCK